MIEISDLTTSYGPVKALDGVTFSVQQGQIVAVLGANGAGKTTMLRTISGLERAQRGSVRLRDRELLGVPAEKMTGLGLSHVPEGRGVITELTVAENLRLGALGRRKGADEVPVDHVYDLFPVLGDRRNATAEVLSGGERQMLVIGRALLSSPTVLLLDEPSLGLAPRIVAQIFGIVRDLVESEGLTVVLVEQNARSALSIADVGVVLNLGKVVVTKPAAELATDEELRHAYLGF